MNINQLRTLASNLTRDHTLQEHCDNHRLAAVLILIYPGDDGLEILLTRRTENLPTHAGQISFPGGSIDPDDPDPVYTALREAREEIALEENEVEILGILDVTLLPSGFAVAPVLGISEQRPALKANPAEVEEIFTIPFSLAIDLEQYNQDTLIRNGQKREFYILEYEDYYIWGATAKMLRSLAQSLS